MSAIGNRIKRRREQLGMSQDELAEKMGYKSRSTIAKIEKGVNDVVQTNIVKFSEVLGVSVAYLMAWDEEPTEETKKDNDSLAEIIVKIRMDKSLFEVVEKLTKLDNKKLSSINQLLDTFIE